MPLKGAEELSPEDVLEAVRRECLAYVAEHYEPVGPGEEIADEDYVGTGHDPEHVWNQALQAVLGPEKWWENYSRRDPETTDEFTDEDVDRVTTVGMAFTAIVKIGATAVREAEHQERLFGDAAESLEPYSPGWTVLVASGMDERTPVGRMDLIVANYLTNVRGGLMDATGLFHDLEEDDE